MKRVALVASNKEYAKVLKNNLNIYFLKFIEINIYDINDVDNFNYFREKYIILSSYTIFQRVKNKVKKEAKLSIITLSLTKKGFDMIKNIPYNTKALLVNIDYRSCMQLITEIFSLGIHHLDLVPYYKFGSDYNKDINIAVTPDEENIVPEDINTVINIGQRVISFNSIIEIGMNLGIKDIINSKEIIKLKKSIIKTNDSIQTIIGENLNLLDSINSVIGLMEQGILIADSSGKITLSNNKANKLLMGENKNIIGMNIIDFFPDIEILNKKTYNDKICKILGESLIISCRHIPRELKISGYLMTVDKYLDIEKRQTNIRKKIIGKGHKAYSNFEDIIGKSDEINKCKKISKKLANSNSSILIIGETGTGKELFAQAIHNSSNRRKNNFVALNCATLPNNLLESELFGYEDGAFSGAKKGGKIGLIEIADGGTLFLDEIGEISIDIQAKLLRFLEEKKFMKLGGRDLLTSDTRIIAATNKNLLSLTKAGEFRNDLYYRLNVLPMKIPSLKKRKNDILLIFEYYNNYYGNRFKINENVKEILKNYSWPGNIRELKNLVEYLSNLNKNLISEDDIPFDLEENNVIEDKYKNDNIFKFILIEEKNIKLIYNILVEMEKCKEKRVFIGRYKLFEKLNDKNIMTSLSEVRKYLVKLNDHGFVITNKGRKGSIITEMGIKLKKEIEKV